jgi:hypothetical protein
MENMRFTTIDSVFAKLGRDIRGTDIHESDVIEYIGECMEEFRIAGIVQQAVCFSEVHDHEADIPQHLNLVLQIARYNHYEGPGDKCVIPKQDIIQITEESKEQEKGCSTIPVDCSGNLLFDDYAPAHVPCFDMGWQYNTWTRSGFYIDNFTPVRLANSTFFNTIVCKEANQQVYRTCADEYTIIQGSGYRKFRFSFKDGYVAIAYTRTRLDRKTGYPLVPDDISFLNAIVYYIKWKLKEREAFIGRQGARTIAEDNRRLWEKYAGQAKSKIKMPQTLDDYQDLLEDSHHMIPKHRRYYGFYGELGREERKKFLDPDGRNRTNYLLNGAQL